MFSTHVIKHMMFLMKTWMWDLNTWSDEVLKEMTNNVIILMSAAGETYQTHELTQSLPEMLEIFLVGTEKRKAWKERSLPKPSELGPISKMKFQSTAKTGKIAMRKGISRENSNRGYNTSDLDTNINNSYNASDQSKSTSPQYRKIWSLMEAACIFDQGCLAAGHCLPRCHANDQACIFNLHERSVMDKQSLKE